MIERNERPLTREDYSSAEDWNKHLHYAGEFDRFDDDEVGWSYTPGIGPYSDLARAIGGHSERAHATAWEKYGASDHLALDQLKRAYKAVALANYRGRVLDNHLTITWSTMGFRDHHTIADLQQKVLELFRKWFLNRGYWPALLWVLENSGRRGLHTHMLISVPGELRRDFKCYAERAVETACKASVDRTPGQKTVKLTGRSTVSTVRQWGMFKYLFKGLTPKAALRNARTGFEFVRFSSYARLPMRPQGEVLVKRFGVSRDLDKAAQLAWRVGGGPALDLDPEKSARDLFGDGFYRWYLDSAGWSSPSCGNSISDLGRLLEARSQTEMEAWPFKLPI